MSTKTLLQADRSIVIKRMEGFNLKCSYWLKFGWKAQGGIKQVYFFHSVLVLPLDMCFHVILLQSREKRRQILSFEKKSSRPPLAFILGGSCSEFLKEKSTSHIFWWAFPSNIKKTKHIKHQFNLQFNLAWSPLVPVLISSQLHSGRFLSLCVTTQQLEKSAPYKKHFIPQDY